MVRGDPHQGLAHRQVCHETVVNEPGINPLHLDRYKRRSAAPMRVDGSVASDPVQPHPVSLAIRRDVPCRQRPHRCVLSHVAGLVRIAHEAAHKGAKCRHKRWQKVVRTNGDRTSRGTLSKGGRLVRVRPVRHRVPIIPSGEQPNKPQVYKKHSLHDVAQSADEPPTHSWFSRPNNFGNLKYRYAPHFRLSWRASAPSGSPPQPQSGGLPVAPIRWVLVRDPRERLRTSSAALNRPRP